MQSSPLPAPRTIIEPVCSMFINLLAINENGPFLFPKVGKNCAIIVDLAKVVEPRHVNRFDADD